MRTPFLIFIGLLFMLTTAPVCALDYYVSRNGKDKNTGTSPESPWRTISKVNKHAFAAGDRILFKGGQIFKGTILIDVNDGGSASTPLIIGSYGSGMATIKGGAHASLTITQAKGIRVNNLILIGLGRKSGNSSHGIAIKDSKHIEVHKVEVSGFQHAGVDITHCDDVRITRVYAHDNGFAGISSHHSTNTYIGYSRAINNPGDPSVTDNHSGNGIVLASAQKATIEYCEAAENGWDMQQSNRNGPVGIWCYESDRVTIQYCISHHNKSPFKDGGGFDFDGGVTNSVMQYNYAYENKSYGFLAWEFGSKIRFANNVYRYNISVNNYGPGFVFGKSGGQGVNDTDLYNNLFYNKTYPAIQGKGNNIRFLNNILVGPDSSSLVSTGAGLQYQGNCYWFPNGGFNVGGFKNLQVWANASGQEKSNNVLVGLHADPLLRDPDKYEKLTDPTKLPTLTAFLIPSNSPVIDAGLNLNTLFSIHPGTRDFYGNPLPTDSNFDIGAQECREE